MRKTNKTNNIGNMSFEEKAAYGLIISAITGSIVRRVVKHVKKKEYEKKFNEFMKSHGLNLKVRFGDICNDYHNVGGDDKYLNKMIGDFNKSFEKMDITGCESIIGAVDEEYLRVNSSRNDVVSEPEESETTSSCEEEAVVNENTSNEE